MAMDTQQTLLINMRMEASQALATVRQMSKAMRDQQVATRGAATAAAEYAREQGRMGRGMRSLRGVSQQAGYQIADLAIVLQQGQDGFKAMAIQGGQFVGALGPLGAALGGVLTVAGLTLSIFKQMREEGGEIPPVMEAVLDVFTRWGAFLKAVALPNMRQFITDVKWAWENIELFRAAVVGLAGAITVLLTPALYRLTASLVALTLSNPFTALALAAVAGAVAVITNWDKVKVFFEFGVPAALESAKFAFYTVKETALAVARDIFKYFTDMFNGIINQAGESLTALQNWFGWVGDPKVWEGVEYGAETFNKLDAAVTRAMSAGNDALEEQMLLMSDYRQAMAELNIERAEAIAREIEQKKAIEDTGSSVKNTTDKFKEWQEQNDYLNQTLEYGLGTGINNFIDGISKAGTDWEQFAKNFLRDIATMIARQAILNALQQAMGGAAVGGTVGGVIRAFAGFADGGVLQGGIQKTFASGGIVGGPSIFPMSRGMGLMGEAGPEAIMPLGRNSQGQLGVAGPSITINNNAGVDVAVVRSDEELIEIAVNRSVKKVQGDFSQSMSTGQGSYSRALEQGYNARRRAT